MLADEELRVASIRSYEILDSLPSDAFDTVASLVAAVCGTPVGLVTVVDASHTWFVAHVGTETTATPREESFCVHALLRPTELLIVPDALADDRFRENPQVVGPPHVRFYAGMPLVSTDGFALGTLCVLDVVPRALPDEARAMLRLAARCVMALLEEHRTSLRCRAALAAQRAHADRLAMLESVAVNAREGVLVLEAPVVPGDFPSVAFANASVTRLTGWAPEKTARPADAALASALAGCEPHATEVLVRHDDGRATLLEMSFSPLAARALDAPARSVVLIRDLSDRKRADAVQRHADSILARNGELAAELELRRDVERRLSFAAAHDSLTDLPNRAYFVERLRARFVTAREHPEQIPFAVMFVDIDRFKLVNDTLGHLLGDDLLVTLARRLRGCVRAHDVVARLGGDEFTVLIDAAIDRETVANLADRIARAVALPCRLGVNTVNVSASIGIAFDDGRYASAEDVLRDADIAMFHAKARGRNRHEFFREELRENVIGEARLAKALRTALECDELRLVYQPIVSLGAGTLEVLGFEALLRWESPYQDELGTCGIVAAAEANGLIVRVGAWVVSEACRQLALWKAALPEGAPRPYVTVNVSARQLLDENFAESVERAIRDAAIAPADLALELTKDALLAEDEAAIVALERLRAYGVGCSIDDFGTGFASLGRLRRCGVDLLKIDRSFVGGPSRGLADEAIVDGIISLAHRLGMETVAEGVETSAQLQRLVALGCEFAQGYALSPPVGAERAAELLAHGIDIGSAAADDIRPMK
ncbi:MAG: EAL domain-containing protein [Vulcanimicrobiaceae bacterium]